MMHTAVEHAPVWRNPATRFPIAVSAVAFDLDGTLLDTLPDIAQAAERMLKDLGRPPAGQQRVRSYVGNGIARLTKRLLTGAMNGEPPAELYAQALPLFERHYADTLTLSTRPYPGAIEVLAALREAGLRLACITNKAAAFTQPLLQATGIADYLDLILSGDSLPRKKPDPLPLQHCAATFDIDQSRLLMVGDSDNDVQAARNAGCPVICVPYGYNGGREVRELNCDAIVQRLPQLLELIQPLAS